MFLMPLLLNNQAQQNIQECVMQNCPSLEDCQCGLIGGLEAASFSFLVIAASVFCQAICFFSFGSVPHGTLFGFPCLTVFLIACTLIGSMATMFAILTTASINFLIQRYLLDYCIAVYFNFMCIRHVLCTR